MQFSLWFRECCRTTLWELVPHIPYFLLHQRGPNRSLKLTPPFSVTFSLLSGCMPPYYWIFGSSCSWWFITLPIIFNRGNNILVFIWCFSGAAQALSWPAFSPSSRILLNSPSYTTALFINKWVKNQWMNEKWSLSLLSSMLAGLLQLIKVHHKPICYRISWLEVICLQFHETPAHILSLDCQSKRGLSIFMSVSVWVHLMFRLSVEFLVRNWKCCSEGY